MRKMLARFLQKWARKLEPADLSKEKRFWYILFLKGDK